MEFANNGFNLGGGGVFYGQSIILVGVGTLDEISYSNWKRSLPLYCI